MKKIHLFIAVSITAATLGLSSCASNTRELSNQFTQGKAEFTSQNYPQAFQNLLPVAQSGNADAQYAVGYMYYYGKGVVENKQQALYWMQLAANQGQQSAKTALAAIHQAE